jgi:DNA-binding PadR family transcriptional regulator
VIVTDGTSDPGFLILISLAAGPKHGHAILLDVESFGGRRLGPGTLYGAIARVEADGLIEPLAPEGRRRPYGLTARGRDHLATRLRVLDAAVRAGRRRLGAPS